MSFPCLFADPLRLHDCSLITDGAAALVIMRSEDCQGRHGRAVAIAGIGHVNERRTGYDYLEGRFSRDDAECCVNLSGGLKAKGHPVGATGVSMHALLYKQLVGEPIGAAPARKAPQVGISFNVGGSAVTNCVTVLRRGGA